MKIQVLTLFPHMFASVLSESILGRAGAKGILNVSLTDIRDFTTDKHKKTDDYPFGGGAGMVLMAQPVFHALESLGTEGKRLIYLSPRGRLLDPALVASLAAEPELLLLCGHYEGVDQRVLDSFGMEEVSVGDYVLTGGELPAMILIDAVARLLPEVLGNPETHREESVYSGLLEYPQYTQPRCFQGLDVPETLLSGHHRRIHLWQFEESLRLTQERRPDLFLRFLEKNGGADSGLDKEEKKILQKYTAILRAR
jgi:tRNA (guanine37-N1)-methyltransferase